MKMIGTKFRYSYADANPLWEVKSRKGNLYSCYIVDCPDYSGVTKCFSAAEIRSQQNWDRNLNALMNDHDKYYANLKVGQVVHYHNAFGAYVRCEVVRDGVENKLKPIALVGDWSVHSLPRRERNGSIYYGTYASDIINGHLFTPSYTCIYEVNPSKYKHSDPRKLKAIDLSVPEMTEGEKVIATGWKRIEAIKALTDPYKILADIRNTY